MLLFKTDDDELKKKKKNSSTVLRKTVRPLNDGKERELGKVKGHHQYKKDNRSANSPWVRHKVHRQRRKKKRSMPDYCFEPNEQNKLLWCLWCTVFSVKQRGYTTSSAAKTRTGRNKQRRRETKIKMTKNKQKSVETDSFITLLSPLAQLHRSKKFGWKDPFCNFYIQLFEYYISLEQNNIQTAGGYQVWMLFSKFDMPDKALHTG